jgi:hypothetical protein
MNKRALRSSLFLLLFFEKKKDPYGSFRLHPKARQPEDAAITVSTEQIARR